MKIAVIGTGYVGLVTGTCFAEMGNDVICVDRDPAKLAILESGKVPFYEPGLAELVERNHKVGRLGFSSNLTTAVQSSDIIFIAVGTPSDVNGRADLQAVLAVSRSIGEAMNGYKVIVTKSTVPVGTSIKVQNVISEALLSRDKKTEFSVVSNPEFLKEGAAVEDFMRPDRIVVGTSDDQARKIMENLYEPFIRNGHIIHFMDIASAEMTKYAANAMLATKISFMNEMARLCERVGADVENVRKGIGSDSRIGFHFIYPGLGYGGSCFPKDVKALISTGMEMDCSMKILDAVDRVNQEQRSWFLQKILAHFEGNLENRKIGIWGLAFKPGTDDMREAPALDIIEGLLARGASILAYDPVATETAQAAMTDSARVKFVSNQYDAVEGVDALVLVTEWREFRRPDFKRMKTLMKTPLIFDGRNQFDLGDMAASQFEYVSVGRGQA